MNKNQKGFNFSLIGPIVIVVVILLLFGIFSIFRGFFRSQETGQVGVWTTPTHKFVKTTTKPGVGSWNPFNKVQYFDVRNNQIKFTKKEAGKNDDFITSPEITVNNADNSEGDVELSVTYSISPDKVESIWKEYNSQQGFEDKVVHQTMREIVRNIYPKYSLVETLSKRTEIAKEIEDEMIAQLKPRGIIVENLSLQGIKYPESVTTSFNTYQEKAIQIESAKAEREKALIDADKKVQVAEKEAKANEIATKELSKEILTQEYIEMLKSTNNKVIITDGKSTPIINFEK